MSIEIREAVQSDAADLARLRWACGLGGRSPVDGDVHDHIRGFSEWWERRSDFVALVARDGKRIVAMGFLALASRVPAPGALDRRHGDIQSVYVLPDYRNHGVGSMLVRALVDHGRKAGCIRITVHSSGRAVPVYERAGFEHSERLMMHPLSD
ncbi:GNAT family N-acetyltransferase [Actinopolymorpha alba]|uniref:GNAT family N-acetyltransferase n=1 Tax=Actinopolymorpha alba TaxID=533267 RepID=UPI00047596EE|nr:GNAT family N-acetyltransferase [Actinopolymorpha alba]